jgi:hypothetical protein
MWNGHEGSASFTNHRQELALEIIDLPKTYISIFEFCGGSILNGGEPRDSLTHPRLGHRHTKLPEFTEIGDPLQLPLNLSVSKTYVYIPNLH